MTIQNILLLVAALVNIIMSIIILSRGIKNKINLYFGLLTFFNFLWAGGLIIVNSAINYELTRFFAGFIYPVALMVVVSLFYFIVHFPYKIFELPKVYKWLIVLWISFYTIFCLVWYKVFVQNITLLPRVAINYEMRSYLVYATFLVVLMLLGIIILFIKLHRADGIFKTQLRLILVAVIIGTLAGSYFNLFFMYFNDVRYNHLGPLFTLVINFIVFYFIFISKRNKQLS